MLKLKKRFGSINPAEKEEFKCGDEVIRYVTKPYGNCHDYLFQIKRGEKFETIKTVRQNKIMDKHDKHMRDGFCQVCISGDILLISYTRTGFICMYQNQFWDTIYVFEAGLMYYFGDSGIDEVIYSTTELCPLKYSSSVYDYWSFNKRFEFDYRVLNDYFVQHFALVMYFCKNLKPRLPRPIMIMIFEEYYKLIFNSTICPTEFQTDF